VADVRAERLDRVPSRCEAAELLAGVELLGATNACLPPIDAALLDAAPGLRGIVLYATGYDHIDLGLLAERGVGLSVLPDYATVAVAEHSIALALALATRLHLAHDRCRGIAGPQTSLRGIELAGRTAGVLGVGNVGRRVARLAGALGMSVFGTDPDPLADSRARLSGLTMVEQDELLAAADVVFVCASRRYGAAPLLGVPELAALRPDALLVNPARAALVDTAAAVAAIRRGHLRGYAVDDQVDAAACQDVVSEGRLLRTGHIAWWRDEVLHRGAELWSERLIAAAEGTPLDVVWWPAPSTDRVTVG
jgi:phosphoglycerate dehydrogenase-like enzyme